MIEEITINVVSNLVIRALSPIAGKALNKIKTAGPEIASDFYSLWVKTGAEKTSALVCQILEQRGYKNLEELRVPSPKFALNYIQGASVEDEPELRKLWAKLLANALDPNFKTVQLRTAYIDVIKGLDTQDAVVLDFMHRQLCSHCTWGNTKEAVKTAFSKQEICSGANISDSDYEISIRNLLRCACLTTEIPHSDDDSGGIVVDGEYTPVSAGTRFVLFTHFGVGFVNSCIA